MAVKFVGKTSTLPISTILYMSESDLNERLKILTNLYKLDYAYICHKGENGAKDHIHIILKSQAKQFSNIDKIRECLYEIVDCDTENYKKGQSKPCKPFVESKSLRDWFLYSIHNKEYLESKGEAREYEYTKSDVKGSPSFIDDMSEHVSNYTPIESEMTIICRGIENGLNDFEILQTLPLVEAPQIANIMRGIEKIRTYYEADASEYYKALKEFGFRCSWMFDEMGLREVVRDHESKNKVRLNYSKVISQVIINALHAVRKEDFYEACKDVTASEVSKIFD